MRHDAGQMEKKVTQGEEGRRWMSLCLCILSRYSKQEITLSATTSAGDRPVSTCQHLWTCIAVFQRYQQLKHFLIEYHYYKRSPCVCVCISVCSLGSDEFVVFSRPWCFLQPQDNTYGVFWHFQNKKVLKERPCISLFIFAALQRQYTFVQ